MSSRVNAPKFQINVSDVPTLSEEKVEHYKEKHMDDTYIHDRNSPEGLERSSSDEVVADLQYKRWHWAQGNQWKYVNVLRAKEFTDEAIQDMANGTRPLCFRTRELHEEFCSSLAELAEKLTELHGWSNVRFIQTGSSVVGFSTNPLKGQAYRPTKITNIDSSDVDVVIVADGLNEWIEQQREAGSKVLGHHYPTTRTQTTFGSRTGCREPENVEGVKEWHAVWAQKMGGGVQVTFDTEANPDIPPWESWIPFNPDY